MIQWYEFKTIITRLSEFPPFSRSFSRRKSQSSRRSSIIRGKNSCVHRASTTFRREIFVFHRRATSLINSTGSPFSDSLKSRVHGRNPFSLSIHKGQPGSLSPLGCHFYVHVFPFIRVTWTRHLYVLGSRLLAADRWTPPAVEKKKETIVGKSLGYVQVNDRLEIMQWKKSIFGYEWLWGWFEFESGYLVRSLRLICASFRFIR